MPEKYRFNESQLVLCIENIEKNPDNKNIGSRIFVLWDVLTKDFLVFIVKRQNVHNSTCLLFFNYLRNSFVNTEKLKTDNLKTETLKTDIESFGYRCADSNDLFTFIEFIVGRKNKININLYIISNFEALNEIPTYALFEDFIDKTNKVASYDDTYLKKDRMINYFNMLKNVNNIY